MRQQNALPDLVSSERTRRTALGVVFATVCVDLLGFGLVMPLLPVYGKELLAHYRASSAGWILAVLMVSFSIMQFVFAPVWGRISDHVGRRPVLLASLLASAVFYWLFGLASVWGSLGWMFAARIGAGIASATIPTAQAYIADVTTPQRRARGMALVGAAFGLGFTLGPLVGVVALGIDGQSDGPGALSAWPGYLAGTLSALALAVAWFFLPEPARTSDLPIRQKGLDWRRLRQALAVPSIGQLLAAAFLAVFALASFEGTISLSIDAKLTEQSLGRPGTTGLGQYQRLLLLFAYIGLIQCLVQGVVVRRLASRLSDARLAGAGAILALAGFVLLAVAVGPQVPGTTGLMVASAVVVAGLAFVFPAVQSLISRRTGPTEQGGVLGAGESISSVARITGVFFGVRAFKQAAGLPYWSSAILMALTLGLVLAAVRAGRDWVRVET